MHRRRADSVHTFWDIATPCCMYGHLIWNSELMPHVVRRRRSASGAPRLIRRSHKQRPRGPRHMACDVCVGPAAGRCVMGGQRARAPRARGIRHANKQPTYARCHMHMRRPRVLALLLRRCESIIMHASMPADLFCLPIRFHVWFCSCARRIRATGARLWAKHAAAGRPAAGQRGGGNAQCSELSAQGGSCRGCLKHHLRLANTGVCSTSALASIGNGP